jgi:hypothetical protein
MLGGINVNSYFWGVKRKRILNIDYLALLAG